MYRQCLIFILLLIFIQTFVEAKIFSDGVTDERLSSVLRSREFYLFEPPLITGLRIDNPAYKPNYIQIFFAMSGDGAIGLLEEYEPQILDRIVEILSQKSTAYLTSLRGLRLLRYEMLKATQQVMWEEEGIPIVNYVEILEVIIE